MSTNADNWLIHQAHLIAGASFEFEQCSCLPVFPVEQAEIQETPLGFWLNQPTGLVFSPAPPVGEDKEQWERLLSAWRKHKQAEQISDATLPPEYWYG